MPRKATDEDYRDLVYAYAEWVVGVGSREGLVDAIDAINANGELDTYIPFEGSPSNLLVRAEIDSILDPVLSAVFLDRPSPEDCRWIVALSTTAPNASGSDVLRRASVLDRLAGQADEFHRLFSSILVDLDEYSGSDKLSQSLREDLDRLSLRTPTAARDNYSRQSRDIPRSVQMFL